MTQIHITTPFGRRPISLGMLASQHMAQDIAPGDKRHKWKLFRAVCEARCLLQVSDRALTVLDALLTFYPSDELCADHGLVVFPSNAQLSLRARGMAAATLRRHLTMLIDAGLILRRDSPNGKRYARRARDGKINEAYGFSLAPLLRRAHEIEILAAEIIADRELSRSFRDRITICRRDIAKLMAFAATQHFDENWEALHVSFRALVESIPRKAPVGELASFLGQLEILRDRIANHLKSNIEMHKTSANESHIERHKQDSKTNIPIDLEATRSITEFPSAQDMEHNNGTGTELLDPTSFDQTTPDAIAPERTQNKVLPLGLVLKACPQISDYGPRDGINSWTELARAAMVVRSMLNVTASAYQRAITVMGAENTAAIMACILERADHIKSPGGYIRDLTSRAEAGKFSINPMLMALARTQSSPSDPRVHRTK